MKKVLVRSAAALVLVLIAAYGYLQYRTYRSYRFSVYKEASLIFRINVDGLIKNAGTGPVHQLYLTFSEKKQTAGYMPSGFTLPSNIFCYNITSRSPETFFCVLPVTDSAQLKQYLKTMFKVEQFKTDPEGRVSGKTGDERLTVTYDSGHLAIAWSLQKENVSAVLTSMLDSRNFLTEKDAVMQKLKASDALVTYQSKNHSGELKLKGNRILISGSFPLEQLHIPDKSYMRAPFHKDAVLQFWINTGLISPALLRFKNHALERDTLLQYYGGLTTIEIGNMIKQENKVISYEFNDDFEKTAQVTVKEVPVPEISITLNGNAPALLHYLQQQQVVTADQQLNKDVFPLYEAYSKNNAGVLQFSTNRMRALSALTVKTPYFFFISADFNKLRKQQHFPFLNDYTRLFSRLRADAIKVSPETGLLEIELTFNDQKQ